MSTRSHITGVTLGQLFPRLDALSVAARRELAQLLAVPGESPALLVGELAALAVSGDAEEQQALRQIIEAGLGRAELERLAACRLGELVPAIDGCPGGLGAVRCPARVRATLERAKVRRWAELARRTVGEVGGWTNMGPRSLAAVVGVAVAGGLMAVSDRARPRPSGQDDLVVLLGHDRDGGEGDLVRLLERYAGADAPTPIRQAAARVLAAGRPPVTGLADLQRVLESIGDDRARGVFEHRSLRLGDAATLGELAEAIGVSNERVRQLRSRGEEEVRRAVADGPPSLRDMAADTRQRLGEVTTAGAVDDLLASLDLPAPPDPRSLLLVWLAGPYLPIEDHAGWLATDPGFVLAETRRLVHEDGGVRPIDHLRDDLEKAGVAVGDLDAWLARQPVVSIHGLAVATTGPPAEVAERLLSATGRAMTVDELVGAAGPGWTGTAELAAMLRRDRRFVRVSAEHLELTEWGGVAYFELGGAQDGPWSLRVEVDKAVLAGSGGPVPAALIESLGLDRGCRRSFTTRFGPVALSHDAGQPARGSLRPVALAAGARAGDTLLLGFHAIQGVASVELVPATD